MGPLPRLSVRDLANKRLTGYLNWQLNRGDTMRPDVVSGLLAHLVQQKPDFVAVTGDLINLGHPLEIKNAARWLKALGSPKKVAVVPGNHDAYVSGALAEEQRVWGPYMAGETLEGAPFPFVRRVGEVAIVGCSSAIPTPPFMAYGAFDELQAERLDRCLRVLGKGEFFRVVMIHHPPAGPEATNFRRGLRGSDLFAEVIASAGAELVLHGHLHKSTISALPGPEGEIPVIGVAAASASAHEGDDPGRYNLFHIARSGAKWECKLTEFGYQRIGSEVTQRLHMRIY